MLGFFSPLCGVPVQGIYVIGVRLAVFQRAEELGVGEDGHVDECMLCSVGGNLVCCDGCPAAYHLRCVGEGAKALKEEMWLCPECRAGGRGTLLWFPSQFQVLLLSFTP